MKLEGIRSASYGRGCPNLASNLRLKTELEMTYKGYTAIVAYDEVDNLLVGRVVHLADRVSFEASCTEDVEKAFHNAIDDYLDWCQQRGEAPDRPFSGKIALRLPPDLHRDASALASRMGMSLNTVLVEAIRSWTADSERQSDDDRVRYAAVRRSGA
jgi:predicted HicB family RNase H-like nuclease